MRTYFILLLFLGWDVVSCKLNLTGSSPISYGTEFYLTCDIGNSSSTSIITWYGTRYPFVSKIRVSTCTTVGAYENRYQYTCSQNLRALYLRIPGERMTTEKDGTTWRCADTTQKNDILSNIYTLNIPDTPTGNLTLTAQPNANNYDEGTTVSLRCEMAGGNPIARLSWTCCGQSVTGTDKSKRFMAVSVLTLTMGRSYDREQCKCIATHRLLTRNMIITRRFDVSYAPTGKLTLTAQPNATNYDEGTTVSLRCEMAGGNPIATLSWTCCGQTVSGSNQSTTSVAVSVLTLTMGRTYDREQCKCIATHRLSRNMIITRRFDVSYTPTDKLTLTAHPNAYSYDDRTSVRLNCQIGGGNPVATLSWTCRGQTVSGTNQSTISVAMSVLTLTMGRSYDREQCKCIASHRLLTRNMTITRTFHVSYGKRLSYTSRGKGNSHDNDAPTGKVALTAQPGGYYYDEGTSVTLRCQIVGGNPVATLSWTCRGQTVFGTNQSSSSLAVSVLSLTMDKSYHREQCKCIATHRLMIRKMTTTRNFHVYYAPVNGLNMTVRPDKTLYNKGESISLTCQIDGGNPIATLSWKCKNQSVNGSDQSRSTEAVSVLKLNIDNSFNAQQCICIATHRLMTSNKYLRKTFSVLCEPIHEFTGAFSVASFLAGVGIGIMLPVIMVIILYLLKLRKEKSGEDTNSIAVEDEWDTDEETDRHTENTARFNITRRTVLYENTTINPKQQNEEPEH